VKRFVPLLCLLATCLVSIPRDAFAQDYVSATGNPSFAVNIPVENGFINISNGNLHLEFPLATHAQRGTLSLNERLVYDSKIWMIGHYSNYYWWPNNIPNTPNTQGGWRFVTGNELGSLSYSTSQVLNECRMDGYTYGYDSYYTSIPVWTDPSGTSHTFDAPWSWVHSDCTSNSYEETVSGYATDASGYSIQLSGTSDQTPSSVTVRDNNGTQVYPQVSDRYGNFWSTDASGNLIDDTGRIPVIVSTSGNVTYYDVLAPNGPINNNGTRIRYTVTTAPVQVQTAFRQVVNPSSPNVYVGEWTGTLYPVQSIQLPDGSSYAFTYDGKATSGDQAQHYGELTSVTLPTGGKIGYGWANYLDSYQNENRWLYKRQVGSDSPTVFTPSVVSYCSSGGTGCQQKVNVHKPSGDESVYTLTMNNGAWNTDTKIYTGAAASGTAIMSNTNLYDFTHPCASSICTGAQYITKSTTTTTLSDTGQQSQTVSVYADPSLGKLSALKEWDYGTNFSGTPTRETDYTYTGFDVQQVTVKDGAGNAAGQTTYGYTSTATATSGVTQHLTLNPGGPYLGTVSHWLSGGNPPVTTYAMDDTGMVSTVTDPKQNYAATYIYQCSNSLPYQVKNALNQTATYTYDCSSGALTNVKDPNDSAASRAGTTYAYEAVAGRPLTVAAPDGGLTTYSYPSPKEMDTVVLATPSPSISSSDVVDLFGRPSQHTQGGVSSETNYDVNGRTYCSANAHFTTAASDGSTCITSYDGLDRSITQSLPGGSTLNWGYAGNVVTSSDESGNQWTRTSDAFGHLIKVIEPGSTETRYAYDGLGNLSTISQFGSAGSPSRLRSFVYDSLSRLTTSTTPEAGPITYRYVSGGALCSGDSSLFCSKTDARGVITDYTYDALNRLTLKQYSDGTHQVAFGYDGRDENGNGLTTPSLNSIGKLSLSSNQVNAASHYSYDANGRQTQANFCIPTNCSFGVQVGASYDLAGNLKSLTYPDGRTISQIGDSAGRLASIGYSNWNGIGKSYSYFSAAASNGYDPAGHLINASMGNGVAMAAGYDNRGRVGTLAYGTSAQLLWGKQHQWTPNSNLQNTTDLFTGVQRQFGYDNLSRLKSAQDILGTAQGANTSSFPTGSGNTTPASSGGATPTPAWTDPDDSNLLENADTPGATGWGVANAAITSGIIAPDGTSSASSFTASAGSTDSYLAAYASSGSIYDGETMTGSVWLRSPSGSRTMNLYFVENGSAGYNVPAFKSVTVTPNWQQFQVSGQFHYGHTQILLQIGGGGTITSGQTIALWGAKLEDSGTSGTTLTNFLPYSQRLTGTTWGINASASDNSATAPDGTNTAATVTATTNDSFIVNSVRSPAPYSGQAVTASIWMRSPGSTQNILMTLLVDGNVPVGGRTMSLSTDWRRFQVTTANANTLSELALQIGGAGTFANGQSIQVWGAQMEFATVAGPYVATGAAPASTGTNLTNILTFSQQPNGSSWNTSGAQGILNAVVAPDGSKTALQLTGASGYTDAYITNDVSHPALYNGATVTGSIFLRAPGGSQSIDVSVAGENSSGRTYLGTQIVQLTSDWKRFTFTGQLPNGLTRAFIQVGGAGTFSSGQTIDVWGAQLELRSSAGPYVMTSALPVIVGQELKNILPNSQLLSGPSWGLANGASALNSATAPDGTTTASTISANSNSTDSYAVNYVPNPSLYDGQTMTASVYLRVGSGTLNTYIYLINVGESGWGAPGVSPITVTTTWQRFTVTGSNQNGLSSLFLQIGGAGTFTGGQALQVWGTQLVLGNVAAPYTPTPSGTTNIATNQPATLAPAGLNEAYSYDSFGNIQQNGSFNTQYTAKNQMFGYAYDSAGNLLSDGINVMTWDAESRMTSAGGATYIYDAEGNRVEKQGVGVTDTIYFGGQPIARLAAGQWTDLIYGPTGLLAEVPGTENGQPIYRVQDHLGSTVGTLLADGSFVNPMDYKPYGQVLAGSTSDPYQFTGLERDQESGLDHTQFRQYSSTNGRWMSPDPYSGSMDLSNPQSFNRYSYVGNMPLGFTDPTGLVTRGDPPPKGSSDSGDLGAAVATAGVTWAINKIASMFIHPQCSHCTTSRPNGQIWDEYHIHYGPNIAGALGLPSQACEFGACGFTNGPYAGQAGRGTLQYGTASLLELLGVSIAYADLNDPNKRLYGTHYCGPGGGGSETGQVDHFCHLHDTCYANAGIKAGIQLGGGSDAQLNAMGSCNQHLCDALSGLFTPYGSQEREAQYGVLGYFRTVSRRRCH
jgi:RHS repeat-associated protein